MDRVQHEETLIQARRCYLRLAVAVGCVLFARVFLSGSTVLQFVGWAGVSILALRLTFEAALHAVAGLVKAGVLVIPDREARS